MPKCTSNKIAIHRGVLPLTLLISALFVAFVLISKHQLPNNPLQANAQQAADNKPDLNAEIQDKISEAKILNLNIRKQTKTNSEFIELLRKLNSAELENIKEFYAKIKLSENMETEELQREQAHKLAILSVARYEELNSFLYRIIDRIENQSNQITNSGFDNEDYNKELETITATLGNIEANNSAIFFIIEKLNKKDINATDAVKYLLNIGNSSKIEYDKVFSELSFLIKDAQ